MSGKQGPLTGACQVTGLFHDNCPEGDGVENRVLVAVYKVSDLRTSPGLQWTLKRERRESSAVCTGQGQEPLVWLLQGSRYSTQLAENWGWSLGTEWLLSPTLLVLKHFSIRKPQSWLSWLLQKKEVYS